MSYLSDFCAKRASFGKGCDLGFCRIALVILINPRLVIQIIHHRAKGLRPPLARIFGPELHLRAIAKIKPRHRIKAPPCFILGH
jgi:hypothetical protein